MPITFFFQKILQLMTIKLKPYVSDKTVPIPNSECSFHHACCVHKGMTLTFLYTGGTLEKLGTGSRSALSPSSSLLLPPTTHHHTTL